MNGCAQAMTTVLITGAAGFIGRRAAAACTARGWTVIGLDRHAPRRPSAAHEHHVHAIAAGDPLPAALAGRRIDGALLLAWPVDPATYLHSPANLTALSATLAVGEALLASGCRTIVGAGTCAEYATGIGHDRLREDAPVRPDTLYAACKSAAHGVLEQLARPVAATVTWARIFNPFGPGESPLRLLPSIVRTLAAGEPFKAGSGAQIRDYIHVDDIAEGLATCLAGGLPGAVNVCSGQPVTLAEVMSAAAAACGRPGGVLLGAKPDRAWDPPCIVGDPGRLIAAGWRPRETLPLIDAYVRAMAARDGAGDG